MVIETLRTWTEKVIKSTRESKDSLNNYANELMSDTRSYTYNTVISSKDYVLKVYKDTNDYLADSLHSGMKVLYFYEIWDYRNKYIFDYSLAARINTVIGLNLPVLLFSHGLRRFRNPLIFTLFAGVLVLPELFNPFNRE